MKASELVIGKEYSFTGNGSSFKIIYQGVRMEPSAFPGQHGFDYAICTDEELKYVKEVK